MPSITFVTSNKGKADYLAKYLHTPIRYEKIDVEEIQSMDLREIVNQKLESAYRHVHKPVLVEDVALEFHAFGRFPGPFIKFLLQESSLESTCRSLDSLSRKATARCVFGYFDGKEKIFFEGSLEGSIAEHPSKGPNGFGWDEIFVANGHDSVRSQLDDKTYEETYLAIKPIEQVRKFFVANNLG